MDSVTMADTLAVEATRPAVLIALSAVVALLIYAYYRFVHAPYQVFSAMGVKGPRPRFLLGSALEYRKLGEPQMYHKLYSTYGPVSGFYLGTTPQLVVVDPRLVDRLLSEEQSSFREAGNHFLMSALRAHGLPSTVSDIEGEERQKARCTLSSILLPTRLLRLVRLMVPAISQSCHTIVTRNLDSSILAGCSPVDIQRLYQSYSREVMCGVIGLSHGALKGMNVEVSKALSAYFSAISKNKSSDVILHSIITTVPCLEGALSCFSQSVRAQVQFRALVGVVSEAVSKARQQHKKCFIKKNYLQILLDRPLTNKQVVCHCLLLLLLGYYTVSSCLTNTSYLLASHPLTQLKLYNEMEGLLHLKGEEPLLFEAVEGLEFLDAVVQESLRLHCLTPKISRVCVKEYALKAGMVPSGTSVVIPVDFVHHLPSYWESPNTFRPDRFTSPLVNGKRPCPATGFLAFGKGSHSCVGMKFATMCVKITLVHLLQRFKFIKAPNTEDTLVMTRSSTDNIYLRVKRRMKAKPQLSFAAVVKDAMSSMTSFDATTP